MTTRTAAELLVAVRGYGATVRGTDLTFESPPRPDLCAALSVLHTGVRALLVNRPWYGCGSEKADACPRRLAPSVLIPVGITLLCVEGDDRWHRIPPGARDDLPHLFEPPPKAKPVTAKIAG